MSGAAELPASSLFSSDLKRKRRLLVGPRPRQRPSAFPFPRELLVKKEEKTGERKEEEKINPQEEIPPAPDRPNRRGDTIATTADWSEKETANREKQWPDGPLGFTMLYRCNTVLPQCAYVSTGIQRKSHPAEIASVKRWRNPPKKKRKPPESPYHTHRSPTPVSRRNSIGRAADYHCVHTCYHASALPALLSRERTPARSRGSLPPPRQAPQWRRQRDKVSRAEAIRDPSCPTHMARAGRARR